MHGTDYDVPPTLLREHAGTQDIWLTADYDPPYTTNGYDANCSLRSIEALYHVHYYSFETTEVLLPQPGDGEPYYLKHSAGVLLTDYLERAVESLRRQINQELSDGTTALDLQCSLQCRHSVIANAIFDTHWSRGACADAWLALLNENTWVTSWFEAEHETCDVASCAISVFDSLFLAVLNACYLSQVEELIPYDDSLHLDHERMRDRDERIRLDRAWQRHNNALQEVELSRMSLFEIANSVSST